MLRYDNSSQQAQLLRGQLNELYFNINLYHMITGNLNVCITGLYQMDFNSRINGFAVFCRNSQPARFCVCCDTDDKDILRLYIWFFISVLCLFWPCMLYIPSQFNNFQILILCVGPLNVVVSIQLVLKIFIMGERKVCFIGVLLHFVGILIQKMNLWLMFFEKSVKMLAAVTKTFLLCDYFEVSHMTVRSL